MAPLRLLSAGKRLLFQRLIQQTTFRKPANSSDLYLGDLGRHAGTVDWLEQEPCDMVQRGWAVVGSKI